MNISTNHNDKLKETNWNRIYLVILGFNAFLVVVFYIIRLMFNHPVI